MSNMPKTWCRFSYEQHEDEAYWSYCDIRQKWSKDDHGVVEYHVPAKKKNRNESSMTSSSGVSTASENLSAPLGIRNAPNETIPLGSPFDISCIDLLDLDPADFHSGHCLAQHFVINFVKSLFPV